MADNEKVPGIMLWGKWDIDTPKSVVQAEFKMETRGLGATSNRRSSLIATTNKQLTDVPFQCCCNLPASQPPSRPSSV